MNFPVGPKQPLLDNDPLGIVRVQAANKDNSILGPDHKPIPNKFNLVFAFKFPIYAVATLILFWLCMGLSNEFNIFASLFTVILSFFIGVVVDIVKNHKIRKAYKASIKYE